MTDVSMMGGFVQGNPFGNGIKVDVDCSVHGRNSTRLPISGPASFEMSILGTASTCPICGKLAIVVDGIYRFRTFVREHLQNVRLSRQQRRQFILAVERGKSPAKVVEVAKRIDPKLADVAKEASSRPDPNRYFRIITDFLKRNTLVVALALPPAVESGLNLWDRFSPYSSTEISQSEDGFDAKRTEQKPKSDPQNGANDEGKEPFSEGSPPKPSPPERDDWSDQWDDITDT